MLALHHAADRKRASHLPNTPEAPWLPTIPLMPLGMHQGKASPELAHGLFPSNTKAGRSVDMAQSKKSVLCLGISCGIMVSQATRITAYDIYGAKI